MEFNGLVWAVVSGVVMFVGRSWAACSGVRVGFVAATSSWPAGGVEVTAGAAGSSDLSGVATLSVCDTVEAAVTVDAEGGCVSSAEGGDSASVLSSSESGSVDFTVVETDEGFGSAAAVDLMDARVSEDEMDGAVDGGA